MFLQATPAAANNPLSSLVMIGALFAVFYFFMIRPGQKQQKKRQEMLSALSAGDQVVTIGGIHGRIISIGEDIVELQVADNVTLKFQRSAIGGVANKE